MKAFVLFAVIVSSVGNSFSRDCVDCLVEKDLSPGAQGEVSKFENTYLDLLCKQDFNEDLWDELTGNVSAESYTKDQAKAVLLRFSKPGGYTHTNKNRQLMKSISIRINRGFEDLEPLFVAANQQISAFYGEAKPNIWTNRHYYPLSRPLSKEEVLRASDAPNCRSEKEQKEYEDKVFELAYASVKHFGVDTPLCEIPFEVTTFLTDIRKMPKEKKDEIFYPLYRGLGSCMSEYLSGLYISKALVFSKSYVKELFGEEGGSFTDLSGIKSGNNSVLILSTDKIEVKGGLAAGETEIFPGMRVVQVYDPPDKIGWKTNGEEFEARVEIETIDVGKYVKKKDAPDYDKMWADGKLSGMTMISPNLGVWKDKATQKYLEYYMDQGFEFGEPKDLDDTKGWLDQKISSGEMDYILKEAHAGGNDYDLIGMSEEHKIFEGVKKLEGGREERIYLLLPQGEDAEQGKEKLRISFDDMKGWMDKREQKDQGELIYLNSSCWSMDEGKSLVSKVESDLFVNIASPTKTTTFYNGKKNTKYHIIDGIRNGKNYSEMLEGMKGTPRHKKGYNDFLFPNMDRYFTAMDESSDEKNYSFEIFDKDGKRYYLHEAVAH